MNEPEISTTSGAGIFRLLEEDLVLGSPLSIGVHHRVDLATHRVLGYRVAVKRAVAGRSNRRGIAALLEESRILCRVAGPNLVRILDVRIDEHGEAALVLEYLEGKTLGALASDGPPLPEGLVVKLGLQVLVGLSGLHALGACHGRLTPDDVLLTPSESLGPVAKVVGFGSALTERHKDSLDADPGKARFAAPEIAYGARPSAHADVFGLAAVLYQALAGQKPFVAPSLRSPNLPRPRVDVTQDLTRVLARALAMDPEARYPNAEAMAAALRSVGPGARRRTPTSARWQQIGAQRASDSAQRRSTRPLRARGEMLSTLPPPVDHQGLAQALPTLPELPSAKETSERYAIVEPRTPSTKRPGPPKRPSR